MLLAHMSDIHLGARKYGENVIYEDVFEAFERSLDEIAREHVEVLVIGGDLFDSPHPDNETMLRALRLLKGASERGIKIFAVHGEHDTPGRREVSPLVVLSEAISGFKAPTPLGSNLSREPEIVNLMTVDYNGLRLLLYPFFKLSIEERRSIYQRLRPYYDAKVREARSEGLRTIFVAHIPVDPVFRFKEETVTSVMSFPRVEYVALGHIHERHIGSQRLVDGEQWYAYPGSLYPLDVLESANTHKRGPLLVDLSSKEGVSISEVNVEVRKHFVLSARVKDVMSVGTAIRATISKVAGSSVNGKGPLVHLKVEVPPGVPARLIESEASRVAKDLNLIIIPHLVRVSEEGEGKPRTPHDDTGRVDVKNVLLNEVGLDEVTSKVIEELIGQAAEGDEQAIESALEKLASWPKSLETLRRLAEP